MTYTLVRDTRNALEVALGTFEGAINPGLMSFGQFKEFTTRYLDAAKHRRIAMFCTGGIRCEKAVLWLRNAGIDNVLQLDGGILGYFEEVGNVGYAGNCFVFDERVAVDAQLKPLMDASPAS